MNTIDRSKVDEILRNSFNEFENTNAFIILISGKKVKVRNGKSVWTTAGAAKNALRNHIASLWELDNLARQTKDYFEQMATRKLVNATVDDWIEHNVHIISVSDYDKLKKS